MIFIRHRDRLKFLRREILKRYTLFFIGCSPTNVATENWLRRKRRSWQSPIQIYTQTTHCHLWRSSRQIKWLPKLPQKHHMHHASVKQTINGHLPRFLLVNFALNARVGQSYYSMIPELVELWWSKLKTRYYISIVSISICVSVFILPSNIMSM